MKQIIIVLGLTVLGLTGIARDRLYIEDFSIDQGETKQIAIMLENDTVYSAFQTDLVLPEGLVVTQENGEYIVDLTDRADRDHTVSTYLQPDGSLRIFVAVMSMPPFSGTSGALALVEVRADADVKGEAQLRGSIVVEPNGDMHYMDDSTASVNGGGSSHITGDVSGDGTVDIADVNAVINMMLGRSAPAPAADVTGDGTVDIADVNAVINIMLGKE